MERPLKVTFADDNSSEVSEMTFQSDLDRSHDLQEGSSITSTDSDDLSLAVEAIMREVYAFQGIEINRFMSN